MNAKAKALSLICVTCISLSGYVFSQRSNNNLAEVHQHLQVLSQCALERSPVDFVVIDGFRTAAEHQKNVENGKSWIRRSRHQDGLAIDFAAIVDSKVTYAPAPYFQIAGAYYICAEKLKIPIVWGGEWKAQDLMHIELDRRFYP